MCHYDKMSETDDRMFTVGDGYLAADLAHRSISGAEHDKEV